MKYLQSKRIKQLISRNQSISAYYGRLMVNRIKELEQLVKLQKKDIEHGQKQLSEIKSIYLNAVSWDGMLLNPLDKPSDENGMKGAGIIEMMRYIINLYDLILIEGEAYEGDKEDRDRAFGELLGTCETYVKHSGNIGYLKFGNVKMQMTLAFEDSDIDDEAVQP